MKIQAKKSLGQNFLQDESICEKIASSIGVEGDNIVEVGPGYGALTKKILAQKPKKLHVVELDQDMVRLLEKQVQEGSMQVGKTEFSILQQDVLKFYPSFEEYSVIANIPYYITSPILHHFLYNVANIPTQMVIMMQKEVGEKILGGKKEKSSVLNLMVAKKCTVEKVTIVPKKAFFPVPKVDSIVLKFTTHNMYGSIDDGTFLENIKKCFREPRKTLLNNLISSGIEKNTATSILNQLHLNDKTRAEDMSIETFFSIGKVLSLKN